MAIRDKRNKKDDEQKAIEINAEMQGTLSFTDPVNLRINGNFQGTLQTKGTLTIGENANVDARITGESIIVAGKVKGDVTAKTMLVLMPGSELEGNISTPKLNIVEGAIFQGKCQMLSESLTIDEVSNYLDIDIQSVVEMANAGNIPAIRDGENWRFERAKVDRWITLEKAKG
ncbi:MAG: polymer-forming cytoskeletal protein [Candidatus Omnitrophica bacterium]|nr:polymer-forming cytoskeletal protein [Candidatus Omnitrophota bacterium]